LATYFLVSDYLCLTRSFLQDLVGPPYRYSDDNIATALNNAVGEIARIRPDFFLDIKYQQPLPKKATLDPLVPGIFSAESPTDLVPIPRPFFQPTIWYMAGLLQFWDVEDTTDVRAQMFHQKFVGAVMSLAA